MSTVPTKRTTLPGTWSRRNVPGDLWPEIFPYLPVKSLLRFHSVSKHWRAVIDSPDSARLHLTRFPNNRLQSRILVVRNSTHEGQECVLKCSTTLRTTATLAVLQTDQESLDTLRIRTTPAPTRREGVQNWKVSCAMDGLFVLRSRGTSSELMLWNPSTRRTRILPPPPPKFLTASFYYDFGIGFDPLIQDYKFFILAQKRDFSFGAVYTVGDKSWKAIDFPGEGISRWRYEIGTSYRQSFCIKGTLFALGSKRVSGSSPLQLVSFDLNSEMFASTALPEFDDPVPQDFCCHTLARMDAGGCTLTVLISSISKGSIWALESLGADIKSWSWTKRFTFALTRIPALSFAYHVQFLSLKKNGVILLKASFMVTSYNLETHEEYVVLDKELMSWPYMENLILL